MTGTKSRPNWRAAKLFFFTSLHGRCASWLKKAALSSRLTLTGSAPMDQCNQCQDLNRDLELAAATYWNAYHRYNGLPDGHAERPRAALMTQEAKRRLNDATQAHEEHVRVAHPSPSSDSSVV